MELVNQLTYSSSDSNNRKSNHYRNANKSDQKSNPKDRSIVGGFIAQSSQDQINLQQKFRLKSIEQEKMFSHKVFSYREQKQLNNLNSIRLRDRNGGSQFQRNQLDDYEEKLKKYQRGKERMLLQQQHIISESIGQEKVSILQMGSPISNIKPILPDIHIKRNQSKESRAEDNNSPTTGTQTMEEELDHFNQLINFDIKQVESKPKLQGLLGFQDGNDLYHYLNKISTQNNKTINSSVDYSPIKNNHQEFLTAATTPNPNDFYVKKTNNEIGQPQYAKIKKFERFQQILKQKSVESLDIRDSNSKNSLKVENLKYNKEMYQKKNVPKNLPNLQFIQELIDSKKNSPKAGNPFLYPVTEEEEKHQQTIQKRKVKIVGTPKPHQFDKYNTPQAGAAEDYEINKDEVYTEEPRFDPSTIPASLNNSINLKQKVKFNYLSGGSKFSTISPIKQQRYMKNEGSFKQSKSPKIQIDDQDFPILISSNQMRGQSLPKLVPVLENNRKYKEESKKNDNQYQSLNALNYKTADDKDLPKISFDSRDTNPQPATNQVNNSSSGNINLRISSRNSRKDVRANQLSPAVVNLANPPNIHDIMQYVITESDEDQNHREETSSLGARHNSLKVITDSSAIRDRRSSIQSSPKLQIRNLNDDTNSLKMQGSVVNGASCEMFPNLNNNLSNKYMYKGRQNPEQFVRQQKSIENAVARLRSQKMLEQKTKKEKLNEDLFGL